MPIDVLRPCDLSAADVAAWTGLQDVRPSWDSPYLAPGWARAVERAWSTRANQIQVAVLRDGAQAVGFLPFRRRGRTAMACGAPMCDYQDLLMPLGHQVDPQDLLAAMGVDRMDFSHLLADSPVFAPYLQGASPSHIIDVQHGYAAYEAERKAAGSGLLKDIDKKRRKAGRDLGEVTFTAYERGRGAFDTLVKWKREQYRATGQTDIFNTPWTLSLIRQLFESRDPDHGGILFTLHFGDRLAAVHFHLRGRHSLHGWLIAHDAGFERYSPGMILFQSILRWMDGTPFDHLDLGTGDYRFKQQLANSCHTVGHGFIGAFNAATLVRSAEYGVRQAMERLPLGAVSALPGKAMRRLDLLRGLR